MTSIAITTILLVALPALVAAPATANEPAVSLYLGVGPTFTPIDPLTLRDLVGSPPVELNAMEAGGFVLLSADGSTMVSLMGGEVVVRDGLGGAERSRFVIDGSGWLFAVSADGGRIVVGIDIDYSEQNLRRPAWKVFDTRTGALIETVQNEEPTDGTVAVDPTARRLYQLVGIGGAPEMTENTGPRPARLIAHDLTTGEEIGRLDLPEIRTGWWTTGKTLDDEQGSGYPVMQTLSPGLAVSPDGRRLAIAHADSDTLTIVATASLTVERTVALTTPPSLTSRVLGWLSPAPQSASAKAMEGTQRTAQFSPDGTRLYLSGTVYEMEAEQMSIRGLGLQVVEMATGHIGARAFDGEEITQLVAAPDGASLYVVATWFDAETRAHVRVLRHLDGASLDVVAERVTPSFQQVLMSPSEG